MLGTADRPLVDMSLGLAVPPGPSDRPAVARLAVRVRITWLDVALGGLIAVAIVWVATRRPVRPAVAPAIAGHTEPDEVSATAG